MGGQTTTSSIDIDAPRHAVMAVIADVEAYPEWSAQIREVEIRTVYDDADERPAEARFVLDAGLVKDTYVVSYDWDGHDEVTWTLVEGGLITALDGAYTLADGDRPGTTAVTYRLAVDLAIPMPGVVRRRAEKVIIDTALRELKKRVENGGGR